MYDKVYSLFTHEGKRIRVTKIGIAPTWLSIFVSFVKFKARILSDALHTLRNKIYSSGEVELFFGRDEYASIQESIRFQNIVTDPDKLVSFVREEVKKRVVKGSLSETEFQENFGKFLEVLRKYYFESGGGNSEAVSAKSTMCQYIARYERYCGQCYKEWRHKMSFKELHDIVQGHDMNELRSSGDKKLKKKFQEILGDLKKESEIEDAIAKKALEKQEESISMFNDILGV